MAPACLSTVYQIIWSTIDAINACKTIALPEDLDDAKKCAERAQEFQRRSSSICIRSPIGIIERFGNANNNRMLVAGLFGVLLGSTASLTQNQKASADGIIVHGNDQEAIHDVRLRVDGQRTSNRRGINRVDRMRLVNTDAIGPGSK